MSSWARPGVKCVCVNSSPDYAIGHEPRNGYPVKGIIYTIRAVGKFHPLYDGEVLQLVELTNPANYDGRDCGWHPSRFRPLVSQSDDVALFTHHLDTTKLPERV